MLNSPHSTPAKSCFSIEFPHCSRSLRLRKQLSQSVVAVIHNRVRVNFHAASGVKVTKAQRNAALGA